MTQLTGSQRRTTPAVPFVAGGLAATTVIAAAMLFAGAIGVRVEVPAVGDPQDGVPLTAPGRPETAPRMGSYDGQLDPVEQTYIVKSRRFQPGDTGAQARSGFQTRGASDPALADDLARWRMVAK